MIFNSITNKIFIFIIVSITFLYSMNINVNKPTGVLISITTENNSNLYIPQSAVFAGQSNVEVIMKDITVLKLNQSTLEHSLGLLSKIRTANTKLYSVPNLKVLFNDDYDSYFIVYIDILNGTNQNRYFSNRDNQGVPINAFTENIITINLSIPVTGSYIDSTTISPSSLRLYYLNETLSEWVYIDSEMNEYSEISNELLCKTSFTGVFAVVANTNLSREDNVIVVYPNPINVNHSPKKLFFNNLNDGINRIVIYNFFGNKVTEIDKTGFKYIGNDVEYAEWDLTNADNIDAGLYYYIIDSSSPQKGSFCIIK